MPLIDNFGRPINYLRLSVTDRCNLRCFYCMPEEGIDYVDKDDLLSYEEMERLIRIFAVLGVNKIRITGGEPFVRKDLLPFLERVNTIEGIRDLHITTNGTLTKNKVDDLMRLNVKSVNLSLDTLDAERFFKITRRKDFSKVQSTLDELINSSIDVKVNMVVMDGLNIEDIIPMIELSRHNQISVRFIEQMPFNETGDTKSTFWDMNRIRNYISSHYGEIEKLETPKTSTSINYRITGFVGDFGIIAAYTRTFCGTCNRLRLTPQGQLQTCLYADPRLDLRAMLREGFSDDAISEAIIHEVNKRHKDGFEAEKSRNKESDWLSMAKIGG